MGRGQCAANKCTCPGGFPATGASCDIDGQHKCHRCDGNHWLRSGSVVCEKCLETGGNNEGYQKHQDCDPNNHDSCCATHDFNGLCCRDTRSPQHPDQPTYCIGTNKVHNGRSCPT